MLRFFAALGIAMSVLGVTALTAASVSALDDAGNIGIGDNAPSSLPAHLTIWDISTNTDVRPSAQSRDIACTLAGLLTQGYAFTYEAQREFRNFEIALRDGNVISPSSPQADIDTAMNDLRSGARELKAVADEICDPR